jgi:signal peptidase I
VEQPRAEQPLEAEHPRPAEEPAEEEVSEESPKKKKGSLLRELPILMVVAFAVALLIKTFVVQAFFIPSASMEPTLREGDRVLVEKLGYLAGEPHHGQVIVFERDVGGVVSIEPEEGLLTDIVDALKGLFGFPDGTTQDFIKRVIAVGGDTIEGRDGTVFVNGEQVDESYLPEGVETSVFGPIDIPEGYVFVMGDNRGNSDDSRSFGPVPEDRIVGHAFVLIWPPVDLSTL